MTINKLRQLAYDKYRISLDAVGARHLRADILNKKISVLNRSTLTVVYGGKPANHASQADLIGIKHK